MTQISSGTALICKNCSRPMLLPEPKTPGVTSAPRNFLCRTCGDVHEYGSGDYQSLDPLEARRPEKAQHVVTIQLQCGKDGCAGLLRIRTLMDFDADLHSEVPGILARSVANNVPCDKGHLLSGPCIGVGSSARNSTNSGSDKPSEMEEGELWHPPESQSVFRES